jgi:hypothetical protein
MSMLHVRVYLDCHVYTACLRLCCMSMSILHVRVHLDCHVYAACLCPCFMSMSALHFRVSVLFVYAACPSFHSKPFCMSILHANAECLCFMSILDVHVPMLQVHAACPCFLSMPLAHAACSCCMSRLSCQCLYDACHEHEQEHEPKKCP